MGLKAKFLRPTPDANSGVGTTNGVIAPFYCIVYI